MGEKHQHEWQPSEEYVPDNAGEYTCACGAEMSLRWEQDGLTTVIWEPYEVLNEGGADDVGDGEYGVGV
jgi:hypothetical protein